MLVESLIEEMVRCKGFVWWRCRKRDGDWRRNWPPTGGMPPLR